MRLRRYLALLTAFALFGVSSPTRAQSAAADAVAAAHGIRLGDALVLHLALGTELGWDSNVFYEAVNPHSSFYLRLNPNFDLTTRPREARRTVEFDLHGGLGYVEYLTGDPAISSHRQFNVDAGLQAAFFTMSPYNFVLFDNYVRSTQPPYTSGSENLNRDTNTVGFRLNLSPGGGRLTFIVGYLFGIDYFEPTILQDYNLQFHQFDLRVSWRFLPKTAVYIAASEVINHYPAPGASLHPDSYPFHVDAGLQGLITTKLTVNLWIGYGNGFYVSGPNPNTAIGGLSATWKPTILSTGTIGYQHDFQNSLLGSYYDQDTAYVSWTQLVWRFTGFLRLQYSNLRYKGVQMIQATTDGTDNLVMLNTRVDYPFKDWLFLSAGYDLALNRSDRQLAVGPGTTTPGLVPVDYTKHVVYLRLTASY
jgi:hypothetical protein